MHYISHTYTYAKRLYASITILTLVLVPASPLFAVVDNGQGVGSPDTECQANGFDFGIAKYGTESTSPDTDGASGASDYTTGVTWNGELSVDWTANPSVAGVVSKEGTATYVHPGGVSGSVAKSGQNGISHITFCGNEPETDETGSITIVKEIVGEVHPEEWSFNFRGVNELFVLTDEADTKTFSDLAPDTYVVTEYMLPDGWVFEGITCNDTDAVVSSEFPRFVTIELEAGEHISCTFMNGMSTTGECPAGQVGTYPNCTDPGGGDGDDDDIENSCLIPSTRGDEEQFKIGTSAEKKLQTILTESGFTETDVEDDETNIQVWQLTSDDIDEVTFDVTILGKYAGNGQAFGYYVAGDPSTFVPVFKVGTHSASVPTKVIGETVQITVPASIAGAIGFAIDSEGPVSNVWHSEFVFNPNDKDNVAVYNPSENTYVLAFEDLLIADNDFNDLVVQISKVNCVINEIPECGIGGNLIENGSFEEEIVTHSNLWDRFLNVTGWSTHKVSDGTQTTLELHRNWQSNEAAHGKQYAELDGDEPTRISQDVTTQKGATYKLAWAFAPREMYTGTENHLSIEVDGSQVATEGPMTGFGVLDAEDWIRGDYTFMASGTVTEIAFKDLGDEAIGDGPDVGTFVDHITLCKVKDPEPEPEQCSITLTSGVDKDINGDDDYTTVVEKGGVYAKLLTFIHTAWTANVGAEWIWGDNPVQVPINGASQTFTRTFGWHGPVTNATLVIASDNAHTALVNDEEAGADAGEVNYQAGTEDSYDVTGLIAEGNNTLSINVLNHPGSTDPVHNPAGLMYKLVVTGTDPACDVPFEEEPTYTVDGYKWNDLDKDGVRDENEPGIAGWTIYADEAIVTRTAVRHQTITDAEGNYSFELPQGEWIISEKQVEGWTQTAPSDPNTCSFTFGDTARVSRFVAPSTCDFGNYEQTLPDDDDDDDNDDNDDENNDDEENDDDNDDSSSGSGGNDRKVELGRGGDLVEPTEDMFGAGGSSAEPEGEVLGESTSIVPLGAPNTGMGGSAAQTGATLIALFGIIVSLATMRITKNAYAHHN